MDKQRIQEIIANIEREEKKQSGGTTTATPEYEEQTPPYGGTSPFASMSKDDLLRLIAYLILADEHPPTVESEPIITPYDAGHIDDPPTEEEGALPPHAHRPRLTTGWMALIALASLLLASTGTYLLLPLFHQEATITITPAQKTVSTTAQLTAAPKTQIAQVLQAHFLTPVSQTLKTTVTTTGSGHQDATPGRGTITFYNGLPQVQTIAGETIFRLGNGIQIATDEAVTVPAAILPTEGVATIPAHSLFTGPQGNIQANAIHGPCCLQGILAYNSAFYGGQAERNYHTATATDITTATQAVKTQIAQSVQTAITNQLAPGEALIPPHCTVSTTANHNSGDEAIAVTVTAQETCKAGVYQQSAVPLVTTSLLQRVASQQVGQAYQLEGDPQTIITGATTTDTTIIISTTISGTYRYIFSDTALQHMQAHLTHMSKRDAYQVLMQTPGVSHVQITATQDILPEDIGAIHITVG